jgi:hypothetical protein
MLFFSLSFQTGGQAKMGLRTQRHDVSKNKGKTKLQFQDIVGKS